MIKSLLGAKLSLVENLCSPTKALLDEIVQKGGRKERRKEGRKRGRNRGGEREEGWKLQNKSNVRWTRLFIENYEILGKVKKIQ